MASVPDTPKLFAVGALSTRPSASADFLENNSLAPFVLLNRQRIIRGAVMRRFRQFSLNTRSITLFGLLLAAFPAVAQFAYECTRQNGTTFISQSRCPDGVSWRRIQTDPYYSGPPPAETAAPNGSPAAPTQSLAQLQAACPKEFDYLAANSEKFKWDFRFRLNSLKAKCAATTVDCYWAFDRLHRHGYGNQEPSSIISAKRQAEAYRAKCGIAEEPKTSMNCTTFGNITTCR